MKTYWVSETVPVELIYCVEADSEAGAVEKVKITSINDSLSEHYYWQDAKYEVKEA